MTTENVNNNPKTKPIIKLLYNGKDCTNDFSKYINSVCFREYEAEQSDELTLSVNNNNGYFTDSWYPQKGDKFTCDIIFNGDVFKCGTFTIDDNNFDFSVSGDTAEIKALATSSNFPVRTVKLKNWSGKTLVQIANEIGGKYGFKVIGSTGFVNIGTIVQKNESDISFLRRISKLYGYTFNIKNNLLTFTNMEDLESSESLFALSKHDLASLNLSDTVTKVYGKCKVQYRDIKTNTIKTYTAVGSSGSSDTLPIYKRCFSLEEAKRVANAGLKSSHREVSGRISIANPINTFTAGVNFDLSDIGRLSGKYHIKTAERRIDNSGYRVEGEIIKC